MVQIKQTTVKCNCGVGLVLQHTAYNGDVRSGIILRENESSDKEEAKRLNLNKETRYKRCTCGREYTNNI